MEGLAPIDLWAILAILAKAAGYGAALLAIGGVAFLAVFRDAPGDVARLARRMAAVAAGAGLVILAARFGIRAARLSGMGLEGAVDPLMLGLIWDSPLGDAALWRAGGEVLILALPMIGRRGLGVALLGAGMVAISFTLIGHSLDGPRLLLGGLLLVHVLAVAFWIGSLAPLHRAAAMPGTAVLLHRFGVLAAVSVPVLILAGTGFAWRMIGSLADLTGTAYGWTLMGKVALVGGLLALAAMNRLRLVPALAGGDAAAPDRLRAVIRLEGAVVVLILLATAALTAVTVPPVRR